MHRVKVKVLKVWIEFDSIHQYNISKSILNNDCSSGNIIPRLHFIPKHRRKKLKVDGEANIGFIPCLKMQALYSTIIGTYHNIACTCFLCFLFRKLQ